MIGFGGQGKERKRRKTERFGLIKCVSLLEDIGRMTASIGNSG